MRKPTRNYWMKLEYHRWLAEYGHLHVCQQGIILALAIWQCQQDDEGKNGLPADRKTIARRLNLYGTAELGMLRDVINEHCTIKNGRLFVTFVNATLLDRRLANEKRRKAGQKGGTATAKHRYSNAAALVHTDTDTDTDTHQRERPTPPGPAPTLRVPLTGELTLTQNQTEELRIKNVDPQECMTRFRAHYANETATPNAWRQKLNVWVARERPKGQTLKLAASDGKTAEQLDQERKAALAAYEQRRQQAQQDGHARLRRLAADAAKR